MQRRVDAPGSDCARATMRRCSRSRLGAHDAKRAGGNRLNIAMDAAEVLAEGLRRSGRRADHEAFVDSLEGLYRFDLGRGPEVTFGPNRRVGAD